MDRADGRRTEIVDAAIRLFYDRDYDKVSIRDLEVESGLTRGAIYYYFSNKEEVYQAVVIDGLIKVRRTIEEAASAQTGQPQQQLTQIVRAYTGLYEDPLMRPIFGIHVRYWFGMREVGTSAALAEEAQAVVRDCLAVVNRVIQSGVDSGDFSCEDPEFTALAMWGLMTTVVQMSDDNPRLAGVGRPRESLLRDIERHVLLDVGIRSPRPADSTVLAAASAAPATGH